MPPYRSRGICSAELWQNIIDFDTTVKQLWTFLVFTSWKPLNATDTYEEMVILVSVSSSIFFRFLPSFPISLPTRLLWARIFRGISSVLQKQDHKLATTEMYLKRSRDSRRSRLTPSCHQPLSAWCPWSCGTWRSSLQAWSGWWSASLPLPRSPYDGCPPYQDQRSDKASWRAVNVIKHVFKIIVRSCLQTNLMNKCDIFPGYLVCKIYDLSNRWS